MTLALIRSWFDGQLSCGKLPLMNPNTELVHTYSTLYVGGSSHFLWLPGMFKIESTND